MESPRFLSAEATRQLREQFGTPLYVYDEATLRRQAESALAFPNPFGLTVRYAMKASPNAVILRLFDSCGLHFDASSVHEVDRLLRAGVPAEKISLSTQELPDSFPKYIEQGVSLNASSIIQLERFGERFPGGRVGLRFNPGRGSGHSNRTNVGGRSSSFGIWHEKTGIVQEIVARYRLTAFRIHTHIGSGSDPAVWEHVADLNLKMLRHFPAVSVLNMGGGYKIARMPGETATELAAAGRKISAGLTALADETGRRIHLEIEPGTYLVANAGAVVSTIQDVTDTGSSGRAFLKLDCGMTEILRPALYGSQHPLTLVPAGDTNRQERHFYTVVGHCCESGDILTPAPGEPEMVADLELPQAHIGDLMVIDGAGAYCSAMATGNYNSFPLAPEVLRRTDGQFDLIRKRQSLDQLLANEIPI